MILFEYVTQNAVNILLFILYGLLLQIRKISIVIINAFSLSITIKSIQYFGGYGLRELDDIICNILCEDWLFIAFDDNKVY